METQAVSSVSVVDSAIEPSRGKVPRYRRLYDILKLELASGELPVGTKLRTEEELCRQYGVSRNTVREALRRLREDGLIESVRGSGSRVRSKLASMTYSQSIGSIDDLLAASGTLRRQWRQIRKIRMTKQVARELGVEAGHTWLHCDGELYDSVENVPLCRITNLIHPDFAPYFEDMTEHDGPIIAVVEAVAGQTVEEVRQEISGSSLRGEAAKRLVVAEDSAAIRIRRWMVLSDGRIAQIATTTHPSSRFRHVTIMKRR